MRKPLTKNQSRYARAVHFWIMHGTKGDENGIDPYRFMEVLAASRGFPCRS